MAYGLIWSPIARLDVRGLRAYISESDPIAARQFVRQIFRAVEHLPDFPESGRIVPEFNRPDLREIIRRPCRIVYRVKHEQRVIEIARVWHAARGAPQV